MVIFINISALAALKVDKIRTFNAVKVDDFVKMTATPFQFTHQFSQRNYTGTGAIIRLEVVKLTVQMTVRPHRYPLWVFHDDVSKRKHLSRNWSFVRGISIGDRWIPLTKTSDAEFDGFFLSAPQQAVEQTLETPVIWNAISFIMTSL